MSKTTDGFSASSRSLNGLNSFNGDDGTFSSLRVDGDINVSATSALNIDGYNPSAGQIIKKTATGMEWANEANNGIDLTEDNTGATNYEIILSNASTATDKTDFKTSALNFQPSTNTLTATNFAGNATSATSATSATNATNSINSQRVAVNLFSITGTNNLLVTPNTTGNSAVYNTTDLNYNSTTDILSTPKINLSSSVLQINGSVTNNKILKTNGSGELTFADETNGVTIDEDGATNSNFGICFSNTTDGATATEIKRSAINDGLYYTPNPTNRKLVLNGILSVSKDLNLLVNSQSGTVYNINLSDYGFIRIFDGVSAYPNPSAGFLLGCNSQGMSYIDPATLGGVTVSASTTNSDILILFQGAGSTSTVANSTNLTFNPSTGILKTPVINLTSSMIRLNGSVTANKFLKTDSGGLLTYADATADITVSASTTNSDIPILFQGAGSTSTVGNSTNLSFNPSTQTLKVANNTHTFTPTTFDTTAIVSVNGGNLNLDKANADTKLIFKNNGAIKWTIFNDHSEGDELQILRGDTTTINLKIKDNFTFNDGSVGINGTPYDELHVYGNLRISSGNASEYGENGWRFYQQTSTPAPAGGLRLEYVDTIGGTGQTDHKFFVADVATGFVSIGMTTMLSKLAVGGNQVVNGVLGVGRAVGTSLDFGLTNSKFVIEKEPASSASDANLTTMITLADPFSSTKKERGGWKIKTDDESTSTNIRPRIKWCPYQGSGSSAFEFTGMTLRTASTTQAFLGIGIESASYNLHVAGTGSYSWAFEGRGFQDGNGTVTAGFWFNPNGSLGSTSATSAFVGSSSYTDTNAGVWKNGWRQIQYEAQFNVETKMRIGDFNTPTYQLEVDGDVSITGSYNPSDTRIKDNQEDYSSDKCLSAINEVELKTYTYNNKVPHKEGKTVLGYIAQQLETITEINKYNVVDTTTYHYNTPNPDYVPEDGAEQAPDADKIHHTIDDFKMVSKDRLIPFLIGAIQELTKKNTSLEKRLSDLENHYFGI